MKIETMNEKHYSTRTTWFTLILSFSVLFLYWEESTAGRVTPFTYGAVGDGLVDDSSAVQSALDTGVVIDLAGGTFRISRTMNLVDGGGIQGPGRIIQGFDLTPPSSPISTHAAVSGAGNQVLLQNFQIQKPVANGSYTNGIVLTQGQGMVLKDLDISGYSARYGIHLIEVSNFEISGCHIHDFVMNTTADMIEDSPAGIRITRSQEGIVSGNRVLNIEVGSVGRESISPIRPEYGEQGYQSDCMTLQECSRVIVDGNVCQTTGEGVDLLLSKHCILSNNVISDTWHVGVKMLGVSFSNATDNHISDGYQGIQISYHPGFEAEGSGNTVNGNLIQNIGSPGSFGVPASERDTDGIYGIHIRNHGIAEGCRYNIVSDNVIVDTQTVKTTEEGVRNDGGPTNLVTDNSFTDQLTD